MPYLIDGHNLIPHVGLRFDMPEDEMELVRILQEFSRVTRKPVEVYFDGAPAGSAGERRIGTVNAHFVGIRTSADAAIKDRLGRLGRGARNWILVSSDREVQRSARAAHAAIMSSAQFAIRLKALKEPNASPGSVRQRPSEAGLSEAEIEKWLKAFRYRE